MKPTQNAADGTERLLRTLGQDDVFGAPGLLARSLRTAAVTGETGGRVFSMAGDDFLQRIGGQARIRDRVLALCDSPAESFSRA
jgi:CRP-like cAMP-binding protein